MPGYDQYKRRVLVVLVGTAPAILTETIYALCKPNDGEDPFVPTELRVVTTVAGKERLWDELLTDNGGTGKTVYERLEQVLDISLPALELGIVVPDMTDETGNSVKVPDAHTSDQLDVIGDKLLEIVREATELNDSCLMLSLAGGRKGMSHLAGQAMSVYGRPQDRLVHVAVDPPELELCKDFYFPDPEQVAYELTTEDGIRDSREAEKARIALSWQPYIPMRMVMEDHAKAIVGKNRCFRTLAARLLPGKNLTVVLDAPTGEIYVQGSNKKKSIEPQLFAYLAMAKDNIRLPMSNDLVIQYAVLYKKVAICRSGAQGSESEGKRDTNILNAGYAAWKFIDHMFKYFTASAKVKYDKYENKDIIESLRELDISNDSVFEVYENNPVTGRRHEIEGIRRKWQGEKAKSVNDLIQAVLPVDVNPDSYAIPKGRQGPGTGVKEHLIPGCLKIEVINFDN